MSAEIIESLQSEEIGVEQQVRDEFDNAAIAGMAQSIRETGLLQPIRVRKDDARKDGKRYVIVDGERRFRACRLAGVTAIPVIIEQGDLSQAEILQKQLIANCQREDLTALEKARAIDQLIKASSCTAAQAAVKLGLSNASVTRLLALLTLPEAVRNQVKAGNIPASAAYELTRIKDAENQAAQAADLIAGRLTRDGLVSVVKQQNQRKADNPAKAQGKNRRATATLAAGRSITLVGDNLTLDTLIESLEQLLAKARKARPKGLCLRTFLKMLKDMAEA